MREFRTKSGPYAGYAIRDIKNGCYLHRGWDYNARKSILSWKVKADILDLFNNTQEIRDFYLNGYIHDARWVETVINGVSNLFHTDLIESVKLTPFSMDNRECWSFATRNCHYSVIKLWMKQTIIHQVSLHRLNDEEENINVY